MSASSPTSIREAAAGIAPTGPAGSMVTRPPRVRRDQGQGGLFRVLVGFHIGDGPPGCQCDNCYSGNSKNHQYRQRFTHRTQEYAVDPPDYTGDLIRTDTDLVLLHNKGGSVKFERVNDGGVTGVISLMDQQPGESNEDYFQRLMKRATEICPENVTKFSMENVVVTPSPHEQTPVPQIKSATKPNFDSMPTAQLKQWAEDHEVELGAARSRDDMLKILKSIK